VWRTGLRKAHTLSRQPAFVWLWLPPVWCLLGLSKALIMLVAFRRLSNVLGQNMGVTSWVPLLSEPQIAHARHIGQTIKIASRYTPWESNCFPQALVARLLLGWFGVPYALSFGLMRDTVSTDLKAHAWVTAGPIPVTGGRNDGQYAVVGVFVSPGLL